MKRALATAAKVFVVALLFFSMWLLFIYLPMQEALK